MAGVLGVMLLLGPWASGRALALPEGRHYEMVSPPYKAGYGVNRLVGVAIEGNAEGDRAVFLSIGQFAGESNWNATSPYLAHRGVDAWVTEGIAVPPGIAEAAALTDLSPKLDLTLSDGYPGRNAYAAEFETPEPEFLVREFGMADPLFAVAGFALKRLNDKKLVIPGAQADDPGFCHIVFQTPLAFSEPEPLLQSAIGTEEHLYELQTGRPGCTDKAKLRLVAVGNNLLPNGEPAVIDRYCTAALASGFSNEGSLFNSVAAGGEEIFFQQDANIAEEHRCDSGLNGGDYPSNPSRLFVRLAGVKTVEISTPAQADCETSAPCWTERSKPQRAVFQGASEDGSKVYFTTRQPLVSADTDTGTDLYMASIGCPAGKLGCAVGEREVTGLAQISKSLISGEMAEVQGVTSLSSDGGSVYFVASGRLTNANAEGASPVKGANNLYVYRRSERYPEGRLAFVADLCTGPGVSGGGGSLSNGAVPDPRCPESLVPLNTPGDEPRNDTELWHAPRLGATQSFPEAQTAGRNDRFLLFSTYARLARDDTDAARDVYRYDAESERLVRVSIGEEGYSANGNSDAFDAQIPKTEEGARLIVTHDMASRAISEDGTRIVFETAEPLSPAATNDLMNAYEWHEQRDGSGGVVSLVSSGSDELPVGESLNEVVITPSGRDIFFLTVQDLLPQDTDGAVDLYDARLGGGFPTGPSQRQSCSGDACQGPLTNPAPLLIPGSVLQAPGENLPASRHGARKHVRRDVKSCRHRGKRWCSGRSRRRHRGRKANGRGRR